MKSKFQKKKQRARIVFQKPKKKKERKSIKFSGKFISLAWSKLKSGIYGTFNGSAERGRKKERKGQRIFILNQGCILNPAKSR